MPQFFPIVASEKNISGLWTGIILSMRPFCALIFTPITYKCINKIGVDRTIFGSGILYSISFGIFAAVNTLDDETAFIVISLITQFFQGIAFTGLTIGEQCLLLTYSPKEDREKNTGMFRICIGIGFFLSPLLGSACYAIGGFTCSFATLGAVYALIIPVIYCKLVEAREAWDNEQTD